jgi:hypothetical protein
MLQSLLAPAQFQTQPHLNMKPQRGAMKVIVPTAATINRMMTQSVLLEFTGSLVGSGLAPQHVTVSELRSKTKRRPSHSLIAF